MRRCLSYLLVNSKPDCFIVRHCMSNFIYADDIRVSSPSGTEIA